MTSAEDKTDEEKRKENAVKLLRAVLTTYGKVGVPVHTLCSVFEETVMEPLKFREMGYGSLEQFLRDCSDACTVSRANEGYLVAKAIATKEDAHVFKLVSTQRKRKVKRSKNIQFRNRRAADFISRNPSLNIKMKSSSGARSVQFSPQNRFIGSSYPTSQLPGKFPNLQRSPTQQQQARYNPPRFRKLFQKQNENMNMNVHISNTLMENIQNQINRQLKPPEPKNVAKRPNTKFLLDNNSSVQNNVELSPVEISALEKKLREILISKPHGLWATRLRPEYKAKFDEALPDNIRAIIQKHFLSFVRIESPMKDMEILYYKGSEGADTSEAESPKPNKGPFDPVRMPQESSNGLINGPIMNGAVNDSLPDLVCNRSPTKDNTSSLKNKRGTPSVNIASPGLPDVGADIKIYVCHIESLDRFFVQYSDSPIDDLVSDMQLYYEDPKNSKDIGQPRIGQYCCARYSKDERWFRSKILCVKEQKNMLNESYRCRVIYVDYGNDEYVISKELKCLTEDFCKLPSQSFQCVLHGLYPIQGDKWPEDIIERFKHLVDEIELTMRVIEKNGSVLSIDLVDDNGKSIINFLCANKFAKKLSKSPISIEITTSTDSSSSESSLRSPTGQPKYRSNSNPKPVVTPKCVEVPANTDYIDIYVSNVSSTADVSITMIGSQYSEQLDKLEEKMAKYFDDELFLPASVLEVGQFYAGLYGDEWCRVELVEDKSDEYLVYLLDHGNRTILGKEQLKRLPQQFLELPFQAIKCSLANVPECFDSEILQFLNETTHRKEMIACVIERSQESKMVIELYDTSNPADININTELIEKIESEKYLFPTLPEIDGGLCNAYITHVSSCGEFFIQVLGPGLEKLEMLSEDMTSHFKQTRASEILHRPEVGRLCCAKFSNDGGWYRAKVTKVMQKERKVEVEFIDYGNREVIQMLFIRNPDAVNKRVVSLPAQAVKCQLSGFVQGKYGHDAIEKMKEFVTKEFIEAQDPKVAFVRVLAKVGEIAVVKMVIQGENQYDDQPTDLLEKFEEFLDEEGGDVFESSSTPMTSSDVFDTSRTNNAMNFPSISSISLNEGVNETNDSTFEHVSILGSENFEKMKKPETKCNQGSEHMLSTYDVINVPKSNAAETENTIESINNNSSLLDDGEVLLSEMARTNFSHKWGVPQIKITERVIEGHITDATDPYKFSFVPVALWEDLEKIHCEMKDYYENNSRLVSQRKFNVGDVCGAYHDEDEIWYRAVIVAQNDDEIVVKYPDFSSTLEITSARNIHYLPDYFKVLSFLALRCSLVDVEPLESRVWGMETSSQFYQMVKEKTFQVEICSEIPSTDYTKPFEVRLHSARSDGRPFNINDELVRDGFARRTR